MIVLLTPIVDQWTPKTEACIATLMQQAHRRPFGMAINKVPIRRLSAARFC